MTKHLCRDGFTQMESDLLEAKPIGCKKLYHCSRNGVLEVPEYFDPEYYAHNPKL